MFNQDKFEKIKSAYTEYIGKMQPVYEKIIDNNRWYKQQQEYKDSSTTQGIEKIAKSGYIFNALSNKHADAMDNYPDINILPKEKNDEEQAKILTSIIPVVMETNSFRKTYSKAWWYKLKNGTAGYGVFWNSKKLNNLGDIEIKKIDILNLAWQPGITDLQESKFIFYSYYVDKDEFKVLYGEDKLKESNQKEDIIKTYDDNVNNNDKVLIIDCYYKLKSKTGDDKLHCIKYSGDSILEFTEGQARYKNGYYEHGKYPFFFDVLYPNEDVPYGFGVIDVVRNPQTYIDKLDQIIQENSVITGKPRYFVKDNGGINEEEFLDLNSPIVHVAGTVTEENLKAIAQPRLSSFIPQHRETKINELKEVIGNRDFQQGGTAGGVTAASAITVLQQSGDKLSRDLITDSYSVYKELIYVIIELIRQFYNQERTFRIMGEGNQPEYIKYSNQNLKLQPLGEFLNPIMQELDAKNDTGVNDDLQNKEDTEFSDFDKQAYRKPEFDISLSVERNNPFNKSQQNSTIMQLWQAGFFNPQALEISLIALKQMNFDGKDDLINALNDFKMQQQQMQQLQGQVQQLQQQLQDQQIQGMQQNMQPNEQMIEIPIGGGENKEQLLNSIDNRVENMRQNVPVTTGGPI